MWDVEVGRVLGEEGLGLLMFIFRIGPTSSWYGIIAYVKIKLLILSMVL